MVHSKYENSIIISFATTALLISIYHILFNAKRYLVEDILIRIDVAFIQLGSSACNQTILEIIAVIKCSEIPFAFSMYTSFRLFACWITFLGERNFITRFVCLQSSCALHDNKENMVSMGE